MLAISMSQLLLKLEKIIKLCMYGTQPRYNPLFALEQHPLVPMRTYPLPQVFIIAQLNEQPDACMQLKAQQSSTASPTPLSICLAANLHLLESAESNKHVSYGTGQAIA